jgi:flavin-dependent dehydrogenase
MAKRYDLIVIGAGPAGLMAAKTAGEDGLKVALLERKTNIADVKRACAMMFIGEDDYYFGERMYFNHKNKKMIFPVNGFTVNFEGSYKNFYGQGQYAPDGIHYISTGDYEERVSKGDEGRLSFVFDKGALLQGLLKETEGKGVDIFRGFEAVDIKKKEEEIQIIGNNKTFEAPFAIAADGVNSRMAQILGLNKERDFYCTVGGINMYMSGVHPPRPYMFILIMDWEEKYGLPTAYYLLPSPYADDEHVVFVGGFCDPRIDFLGAMDYFIKESPFSSWFTHPEVRRRQACIRNFWAPLSQPFKDNVLLVGDSTWSQETEMTGALMCGWKAAHAVSTALKDHQLNREGVMSYLNWWNKSFPEFHDYRAFFGQIIMMDQFTREDVNYLFSIIKDPLPFSMNPYKMPQHMGEIVFKLIPQIQAERPELLGKLQSLQSSPLEELLKRLAEAGFPNR